MRRRGAEQRGFTLIEIVIALAILAALVTVTYNALNGLLRIKQYVDDRRVSQAIANSILLRMTRELQLADPETALLPPAQNLTERYPRNFNLSAEPAKIGQGQHGDSIKFMARGAGQYVLGTPGYSDVVQISYRVAEDSDQQSGPIQTYVLVREETPAIRPYERAYEKTMRFPVTAKLLELGFRFYDAANDRWVDNWGTNELVGLPVMVELNLAILTPDGRTERFITAVPLRGSQSQQQF
ncbi:MAG: prepilin-type N-terminal cleavage/methylation domain-containing protein [Oligoflexia bacterium]|nr:prepilin-type N-terminal cleavage/methylation domain-containing protein [Oligoflexia bacterium]